MVLQGRGQIDKHFLYLYSLAIQLPAVRLCLRSSFRSYRRAACDQRTRSANGPQCVSWLRRCPPREHRLIQSLFDYMMGGYAEVACY